ncbi:MAG: hypothetical protein WD824_09485 [Cyclobacteriaceae bacterium]
MGSLVTMPLTGFNRFDLGVPVGLRPVPREEMEHYTEFQQFLNGGCCVSTTAYTLDALYTVGMTRQADMIFDAITAERRCFSESWWISEWFC